MPKPDKNHDIDHTLHIMFQKEEGGDWSFVSLSKYKVHLTNKGTHISGGPTILSRTSLTRKEKGNALN